MAFYRTYRPQTLDEIDNVAVRDQLLSLLTKDKKQLPHAYLFTGPRGAGKTTAARLIAKLFNCTKPTAHGPCGTCDACTTIAEGRHMDVLEIDAASNRGIDEIRALRDAINLAPSSALFKVYIIDEVHMLTTEAFNALLKTLEEPPAHAVFVLATTDPQKVPATIKSRCVGVSFHKASANELTTALARIVKAEKIAIEEDALQLIAASVDGSFRDGVKLLETVSFEKGTITQAVVRARLSISDDAIVGQLFTALAAKDRQKALSLVQTLVAGGNDMKAFMTQCFGYLQAQLLSGNSEAKGLIHLFTQAYGLMKISPIAELPLELVIVEYCGDKQVEPSRQPIEKKEEAPQIESLGLLTIEKLTDHWLDFIAAVKPFNNSIAGVIRSARPKSVEHGIVTIEAFYSFHKDKLSESKTKDILVDVLKRLFGEKVKVEIVLGKK